MSRNTQKHKLGKQSSLLTLIPVAVLVASCTGEDDARDRPDADTGNGGEVDADETPVTVEVDDDITSDTLWEADVVYVVTETVSVTAKLEIEPGTTVEFERATGLVFDSGSEIDARGEPGNEILFTGSEAEPGHWRGIGVFQTEAAGNIFDHVIIEYGGGFEAFRGSSRPANLQFGHQAGTGSDTDLALTNSTLRFSDNYGLAAHWRGHFIEFEGNEFSDNENAPVRAHDDVLGYLDTESSYAEGNGVSAIVVPQRSTGINSATWANLDVPYRLTSAEHEVTGSLTIEPGTELEFEERAGIKFSSSSTVDVRGEEGNEILFTGTEKERGHWRGIWVTRTESSTNAFDHVIVEYGGESGIDSHEPANLALAEPGGIQFNMSIDVTNSEFSNSGGYGVSVWDSNASTNDIESENEFVDNESGAFIDSES